MSEEPHAFPPKANECWQISYITEDQSPEAAEASSRTSNRNHAKPSRRKPPPPPTPEQPWEQPRGLELLTNLTCMPLPASHCLPGARAAGRGNQDLGFRMVLQSGLAVGGAVGGTVAGCAVVILGFK